MTEGLDRGDGPSIAVFDDTANSGAEFVAASLAAEIASGFGPPNGLPLAIVASAGDAAVGGPVVGGPVVGGPVVGGLNGVSHWGWCYIRHLWVHADWRRRGLGHRLLAEAETQARARACVGLYVDTFDPGAAAFYERAGFVRFGLIEDFPPGHARVFLRKTVTDGI